MAEEKTYTIYELFSADESFPERYIGKTTKSLCKRLTQHKWDATNRDGLDGRSHPVSSSILFLKGLVAIRSVEKEVAEGDIANRERWHIENTPNCVNQKLAWATKQERVHAGYVRNIEKKKQYAADHVEQLRINRKRYQDKIKDVVVHCEFCNSDVKKKSWSSHIKSQKHVINAMDSVQSELEKLSPQNA
jgi:uncharacterized protein YhaN